MPAYSGGSNGPFATVAAMPVRFGILTFAVAGTQQTNELFGDGLPGWNAWFLQTAGAGNVSIQLEFEQGLVVDLVPSWQPLVPAYGIVLTVPSLVYHSLGASRYRASITSTGVATVRYQIVARLT
jgi:hypothetical protein